jgi:flavodoxin
MIGASTMTNTLVSAKDLSLETKWDKTFPKSEKVYKCRSNMIDNVKASNTKPVSRRKMFKLIMCAVVSGTLQFSPFSAHAQQQKQKVLTVFFSKTNNTRTVANQIHSVVGGDIVELKTVQPYPIDHDENVRQAVQERRSNARPPLSTEFPQNMDEYDVIFVGYPVWEYTMPMAFFTFFDKYKFAGKKIVPFSTHLGSRLGHGPEDIAKLCPQAKIVEGLAIRGPEAANSQKKVFSWLQKIGMTSK